MLPACILPCSSIVKLPTGTDGNALSLIRRYRGMATRTSCPLLAKAFVKASTTSASPPVFTNGISSAAAWRIRRGGPCTSFFCTGLRSSVEEMNYLNVVHGNGLGSDLHEPPVKCFDHSLAGKRTVSHAMMFLQFKLHEHPTTEEVFANSL